MRRCDELREELEEAIELGDATAQGHKGSRAHVELACAGGLHERDRRAASASERARLNGTRLKHSIKTGPFRSYVPGGFRVERKVRVLINSNGSHRSALTGCCAGLHCATQKDRDVALAFSLPGPTCQCRFDFPHHSLSMVLGRLAALDSGSHKVLGKLVCDDLSVVTRCYAFRQSGVWLLPSNRLGEISRKRWGCELQAGSRIYRRSTE